MYFLNCLNACAQKLKPKTEPGRKQREYTPISSLSSSGENHLDLVLFMQLFSCLYLLNTE